MTGEPAPATTGAPEDVTRELRGLVYELARRLREHVRDTAAGMDLTERQANALRELGDPLTMRELAGRMCCEPPNVTFAIDRLAQRGLVERRPYPGDRRAVRLVLTEEGRQVRERLLALVSQGSPLAHLSPDDTERLRDSLLRAVKH